MKRNRIILFAGKQTNRHHIHCFRILIERFGWNIHLVTIYPDIADMTRNILSIDTVYLVKSFAIPFFEETPSLMDILTHIRPDMCVILGSLDNRFQSYLKTTNLPIIWIREIGFNPSERLFGIEVKKQIQPSILPQVSQKQSTVCVPAPMVHYQDFLDLDIDKVLEYKRDCGLISHNMTHNAIQKKTLVAVLGTTDQENALRPLFENQDTLMYSILNPKLSDVDLPAINEENAPIIYELCDALVVIEDINDLGILSQMRSMASGTVMITPRTEKYLSFLGRGSLYYEEYSLPEIQACLEILNKSSQKRQEVREVASLLFEKRYGYSAVSGLWNTVLEYVAH